jgi:hypothetical protein
MVGHQAEGNNVGNRKQLFPDLFQKEQIISFIKENNLLIISPVINMIEFSLVEMHIGLL